MLKNYLKTAYRILTRHKLYTAINIFGLAIGLALCLIVIGHISYECSFEDSHINKDRIYRINGTYTSVDTVFYRSRVMPPLGQALKEEIPEIEKAAVFRVLGDIDLQIGESSFSSDGYKQHGFEHDGNVFCANPDFLQVFTVPLVQGDPNTALNEPFSILISEKAVAEYFGDKNPMGQIVKINDDLVCQVTGIMKNLPENTQIYCDFIVSYASLESIGEDTKSWDNFDTDYVYLLLRNDVDPETVRWKIPGILKQYMGDATAKKYTFELQPLKDIYFSYYGSGRYGDLAPHGEISMMYEIGFVAAFILLLAIANFINLSTARSADRMREVGMRKVFGAPRRQLIGQFLGESILITFISVMIGIALYELFKFQVSSSFMPREAFVDFYNSSLMLMLLAGLILVVGIIAGFYPALYLSRFKPITILQQKVGFKSSKSILRKVLVVFQFSIAVMFICCTIILYSQITYMTSIERGFRIDDIIIVDFAGDKASDNCRIAKAELAKDQHIHQATVTNNPPGRQSYAYYGYYRDEGLQDMVVARAYMADYDFLRTFDIDMKGGHWFSEENAGNNSNAIIINESFADYLGLENPIGYRFYRKDDFIEVIGVVKDFYGSTYDYSGDKGNNAVIVLKPEECKTLALRLEPNDNIQMSIASLRETWQATFTEIPFTYSFLIDEIEKSYGDFKKNSTMFFVLSLIAIIIACLGIFGLVSYTAEQKTREIGIRKVLGASIPNIVNLLSREFIILVAIANLIAWPLAYMFTQDWLQYFIFRADIGVDKFLLTGFIALLIALLTAGIQAVKAALADPVETLRYE